MQKIGEYLLEQGLLTVSQIKNVLLLQQKNHKKYFGQWCIDLLFLSEEQVYQALAKCWGYEYVSHLDDCHESSFYHFEHYELEQYEKYQGFGQEKCKVVSPSLYELWQQHLKAKEQKIKSQQSNVTTSTNVDEFLTNVNDKKDDLLQTLLEFAHKNHASDVHLEPFKDFAFYRMRIDGVLMNNLPQTYCSLMEHQVMVSRIKALAKLDIAQNRLAQDGRMTWQGSDIRIAIHPTQFGEKVVLRLFYTQHHRQLSELNLNDDILARIQKIIHQPQGLFLFTGPTGSGKTSLMYSFLGELNRLEQNIMTIEEPVEYRLPYLQQTDLSENQQMTWESSLKSLLRQDPDTIILGELRDEKTAKLALQACLTGHRIWATVHSNSAVATFARFAEWGIDAVRLTSGITAVIQQRLIKKKSGKGRELIIEILDNSQLQLTSHLIQGNHWFDFQPFITLKEHALLRLQNDEVTQIEIDKILG